MQVRMLGALAFASGVCIGTAYALPERGAAPPVAAHRSAIIDGARRIDANQLDMAVTNFGSFAFDHAAGAAGLIFPTGSGKTAVFASGLWLTARVAGEPRTSAAWYTTDFQPGAMTPGGGWQDPARPEFRVWKVSGWTGDPADTAHVERAASDPALDELAHHGWGEYLAGAAPYGAPVRTWRLPVGTAGDSVDVLGPDVHGVQMVWSVYHDANPAARASGIGTTQSLGVEIQQTMSVVHPVGKLGRVVFLRFAIHNRGTQVLDSLLAAIWSDIDLGTPSDDLVGNDSTRAMSYVYNASVLDPQWGLDSPALGYEILRSGAPGDPPATNVFASQRIFKAADPVNAIEADRQIRGLRNDGSSWIDPVSGRATRFTTTGDPVTSTGWIDAILSDRRLLLTAGPFQMVPGDTVVVEAAIVVGQASGRLRSIQALRCNADGARLFQETGQANLDTMPASCTFDRGVACPRESSFWRTACTAVPGAAPIAPADLERVAEGVDARSLAFDFGADPVAGFCAIVGSTATDARTRAKQEVATALANDVARVLGVQDRQFEDIALDPEATCELGKVSTLLAPADTLRRLYGASYLNAVPSRQALEGVDWGGRFFGGGADYAAVFTGSALDTAARDSFPAVVIRFDMAGRAYRFLRLEREDGTPPPGGPHHRYAGFPLVPVTVWDTARGVQLDVAFVERAIVDDSGNPAGPQPSTQDGTWAPDTSSDGGHEYLYVLGQAYTGSANAATTHDDAIRDGTQPWLYVLGARRRAEFDVIDPEDRFVFHAGAPPASSADARLLLYEGRPLSDPLVAAVYDSLAGCLDPLNRGVNLGTRCGASAPPSAVVLSAYAASGFVSIVWSVAGEPGATLAVQRKSESEDWQEIGYVAIAPNGTVEFQDHVTPGRWAYRLVPIGSTIELGFAWIEVPESLALRIAQLHPNPTSGPTWLSFVLPIEGEAEVELFDIAGRRVERRRLPTLLAGAHVLPIDLDVRPGFYLLRLSMQGRTATTRVVVTR